MIRVGILGTGFGKEHLRLFCETPDCQVVRVYGRNKDKLEGIRGEYNVDVTTDPSEVVDDHDIDLVDICLPSALHKEYALRCLDKSKNIFIETPLCYALEDAKQIREAAAKMKKNVYVSSFIKFFAEYVYLKSILESNQLGQLKVLRLYRDTPVIWGALGLENIVHHLMIHDIDFISWLLDKPAVVNISAVDVDSERAMVVALFKTGDTLIQLQGCSLLPRTLPMSVGYQAHFDSGEVDFHCVFTDRGPSKRLVLSTPETSQSIELEGKYPYKSMIEHVIACDVNGVSNLLDIDSAIAALHLANEIKRKTCPVHPLSQMIECGKTI